jgi:P-type Ca2+ transporter type 2C
MAEPVRQEERAWHATSSGEVLELLGSRIEGLDEEEARRRLDEHGPNDIPVSRRTPLAVVFLHQFRDPLIYILLAAAAVSVATGHAADAIFIFAVLLVNAAIGVVQESKAERSAEALRNVIRITATVRRGGDERSIDATELVPGDIVVLTAGDAVAADLRLLEGEGLRIDESLLTGESLASDKDAAQESDAGTPVADRHNMAFAGTSVAEGRGAGAVVATALRTELGRIAESLSSGEAELPPLVIRMKKMSRTIGLVVLGAVALLAVVQFARARPLEEIFFLAVALAVAAIPEGLPVSITVALAVASRRMAERRVIVRRLPAVEGLGTCTLIASDKTGTLTGNRLTVVRIRMPESDDVSVEGGGLDTEGDATRNGSPVTLGEDERLAALVRAGVLCNEAQLRSGEGEVEASGDAVDIAFLVLGAKFGVTREDLLEDHPERGKIAYEPRRKYAAAFHEDEGGVRAFVKGAAEAVIPMCADVDRSRIEEEERELASRGYRVLALASGRPAGPEDGGEPGHDDLRDLEFLGLTSLIDPLREEVPAAIDKCRSAGIDVRMITGDHPATALAIARELGMAESDEDVITGAELRRIEEESPDDLAARIAGTKLFSRVAPDQKTAIVAALQRAGHFVAVTGDGVNDAPALRAAHIGVAMGESGTDVARSASDLILTDDNFASIVNGVEEGRIAYSNVRKVTWLLVSMGVAEIALFFFALLADTPLPLTAIQVLWLNLVTNGIQDKALAFEKGEPGILSRPPRSPGEGVFDRRMIEQTLVAGLYTGAVAFLVFYYLHVVRGLGEFEARNLVLLGMVLFENVHVFNTRSETRSTFRIPLGNNWLVVGAVILAQGVHIAAMFTPGLRDVLDVEPVSAGAWLALLPISLTLIAAVELYKWLRREKAPAAAAGGSDRKTKR